MGNRRHWMVCECFGVGSLDTPCVFDEDTALRRGDPPRCIRHGALLFSDTTLDGMTHEMARKRIQERFRG